MLDIRTLEALEKLFASGTHGLGRFTLTINVNYGKIEVEEGTPSGERIAELENEVEELQEKLDEISSMASY